MKAKRTTPKPGEVTAPSRLIGFAANSWHDKRRRCACRTPATEDRARYNFVRARSRMYGGLLLSQEDYDAEGRDERVAKMYESAGGR